MHDKRLLNVSLVGCTLEAGITAQHGVECMVFDSEQDPRTFVEDGFANEFIFRIMKLLTITGVWSNVNL